LWVIDEGNAKRNQEYPFPEWGIVRVSFWAMVGNQEKRMGNPECYSAFGKRGSPFQSVTAGKPFNLADIEFCALVGFAGLDDTFAAKIHDIG
jgi:hypothetical protein